SRRSTRSWPPPTSSNRHSWTPSATSENSVKFVPMPSYQAPSGYGSPGQTSRFMIGNCPACRELSRSARESHLRDGPLTRVVTSGWTVAAGALPPPPLSPARPASAGWPGAPDQGSVDVHGHGLRVLVHEALVGDERVRVRRGEV